MCTHCSHPWSAHAATPDGFVCRVLITTKRKATLSESRTCKCRRSFMR